MQESTGESTERSGASTPIDDPFKFCSIVIPFRSDGGARDANFLWLLSWWKNVAPNAELIVADSDSSPHFWRSRARNEGISIATRDVLIIADADSFCQRVPLVDSVGLVLADNDRWALPYQVYLNLDDRSSRAILDSPQYIEPDQSRLTWDHWIPGPQSPPAVSGVIIVGRQAFLDTGGYDERFTGWGYEDTAMACQLTTLIGPVQRRQGFCYHLWHPAPNDTTFGGPRIEDNRALYEKYRRAGSPQAMRGLISER